METKRYLKSIYAITNTGDTIGKLNLSCSKPVNKKIFFIYVNIGQGYDSSSYFDKDSILNQLNKHSHNQVFRKWELATDTVLKDKLDITAEYNAHPEYFSYDSAKEYKIDGKLKSYYNTKFNLNLFSINTTLGYNSVSTGGGSNSSKYIRFLFLFPKEMNKIIAGNKEEEFGVFLTGGKWGCVYKGAPRFTFAHELFHGLNNSHTFEIPYSIPIYSTTNIMDYKGNIGSINYFKKSNHFWFTQWLQTY